MKNLLFLLLLVPFIGQAQTAAPWKEPIIYEDSVGSVLYRYNGLGRTSAFPALSYVVPGSAYINCKAPTFHIRKNNALDTVILEQLVVHKPAVMQPSGTMLPGDSSWQPVTYLNMQTGTLDTSGIIYLDRPSIKVQVYDMTPNIVVRLRTRYYKPSAQRVTFKVY